MTTPSKPSEPKKIGRPRKIEPDAKTLATLTGLGNIQATTKECAAVLRVSERTFITFLDRSPEARDVYEDGKEEGKASLRRTQFKMAQTSAAMAIFLGKNYLGQRDDLNNHVAVQVNLQVNDARDKLAHLIDSEAVAIVETEGPLSIN